MAIDCLLIEPLLSLLKGQPLKESGVSTAAFATFLRKSTAFGPYFMRARNAGDFYDDVRNGLLHDGETRADWKIQKSRGRLLTEAEGSRILDRTLFTKPSSVNIGGTSPIFVADIIARNYSRA